MEAGGRREEMEGGGDSICHLQFLIAEASLRSPARPASQKSPVMYSVGIFTSSFLPLPQHWTLFSTPFLKTLFP